jgi:hypothetical protein
MVRTTTFAIFPRTRRPGNVQKVPKMNLNINAGFIRHQVLVLSHQVAIMAKKAKAIPKILHRHPLR